MILYSYEKKFMGMDHEDLQQLGYKTLPDFIREYQDFADTFIDRPGYVYNYDEFSWIDYVLNSNDSDFKAMIYANGNGFACDIEISPYYLISTPEFPAYAITLHHIRALSKEEVDYVNKIATSSNTKITHVNMLDNTFNDDTYTPPEVSNTDSFANREPMASTTPMASTMASMEPALSSMNAGASTPAPSTFAQNSTADVVPKENFSHDASSILEKLKISKNYQFDPIIAAEELGLAVEVIQEFIDDYVEQAHDFQEELINATHKKDFKEVEGISHKLKGVAANLRIDDSLEVLTRINSSQNQKELEVLIEHFYTLIEKLHSNKVSMHISDTHEEEPEALLLSIDDDIEIAPSTPHDADMPTQEATQTLEEEQDLPEFIEEELPSITNNEEQEHTTSSAQEEDTTLMSIDDDIPSITEEPEAQQATEQYIEEDALELDAFDDVPELNANSKESVDTTTDTPSEVAIEETALSTLPELQFNPLQASNDMGIDMELFLELLEEFKEDATNYLNAIESAISTQDATAIEENSMLLKDISDNLHIQEISSTLQTLYVSKEPVEQQRLYDILQHYMTQL